MSITNWFVNKYIRTEVKNDDLVDVNSIVVKYVANSRCETESKVYINNKLITCHGPYTCSMSVKAYIKLVYNISLESSQKSKLAEMFKYKVSGHIKLSKDLIMEIKVV